MMSCNYGALDPVSCGSHYPSKDRLWTTGSADVIFFIARPNSLTPEILEPDVAAPGVNILAACGPTNGPAYAPVDLRRTPFVDVWYINIMHVAAITGLLKSLILIGPQMLFDLRS
ncbi:hypothetical protein ACLOJK_010230 [Asimina triloba]